MTYTEEHPRAKYLRDRAAIDSMRCEVILKDALWSFITDGRDSYTLPDTEDELERVANRLRSLLQSGVGARVEALLADVADRSEVVNA